MIAGQSFGSDRQTVQYERNIRKHRDVLVSWNTVQHIKICPISTLSETQRLNWTFLEQVCGWFIPDRWLRIQIHVHVIALPNEQHKIFVFYFPQLLTRSWEQYQQFNNKGRGKVLGLWLRKFCWHNIALVHTLNDMTNRLMV